MPRQLKKRWGQTVVLVWGLTAGVALSPRAGIVGSKHDFSNEAWNPTGEICVVCHAPHNGAGASLTEARVLWNREITQTAFQTHIDILTGGFAPQPDGASRLCLGCHDGTIPVDRFGDNSGGAFYVPNEVNFGMDISQHPTSGFGHVTSRVFDATFPVGFWKNPTTAPSGFGGTVDQDILKNHKVQCSSCHNPHGMFSHPRFLVKNINVEPGKLRPTLCLTCHFDGE